MTTWAKTDQELVAEGEHVSSVVGVRTGRNVESSFEDRHVGNSFAYLDGAAITAATCPGIPQGHPILVPVYAGARNVIVRIAYEAANGAAAAGQPALRARLVIDSYTPGAWVDLDVTSATDYADLECAIPIQRRRRLASAQIQIESYRGPAELSSNVDTTAIYGDQRLEVSAVSALTTGVQYLSIVWSEAALGIDLGTARAEYFLGWADSTAGQALIWPALDGAIRSAISISDTGTVVYNVGALSLYGWCTYVEGSDTGTPNELIGCLAVPEQSNTLKRTSSTTFRAINAAARQTYADRGRWWCSHPRHTGSANYLGARIPAAGLAFSAMTEVRSGSTGLMFGALYMVVGALVPTTVTWTVSLYDEFNDLITDATYTTTWDPQAIEPSVDGNSGSIAMANLYGRDGEWGQRDLVGAAEHSAAGTSGALGRLNNWLTWPGLDVGDTVIVRVTVDVPIHIYAACIAEDGF